MRVSRTSQILIDRTSTEEELGDNSQWSQHMATMTNKANSKLSCLRRNWKFARFVWAALRPYCGV